MACNLRSMFTIQTFFCCCSIKTGTLFLGYLAIISNFINMVGESVSLSYCHDVILASYNNNNFANKTGYYLYFFSTYTAKYYAMFISYQALSLIFSVALIWGTHQSKHQFLLPWLILKALECIAITAAVLTINILIIYDSYIPIGFIILIIILSLLGTWLTFYTYACVYSHYNVLKSIQNNDQKENFDLPTYEKAFHDKQLEPTIHITMKDV